MDLKTEILEQLKNLIGKYIVFLNGADDWMYTGCIKKIKIDAYTNTSIVYIIKGSLHNMYWCYFKANPNMPEESPNVMIFDNEKDAELFYELKAEF